MNYDCEILKTYAKKLLSKANSIEAGLTFLGAIIGCVGFIGIYVTTQDKASALVLGGIVAAVITYLFFLTGRARAQSLRVQANMALVLVEIESRTRKS